MVRGPLHGIARYALELARRLPQLAPGWQFIGLVGPEGVPDELGELTPRIPLEKSLGGFLSAVEQPALLASLLKVRPDLFHATSFSLPALWSGRLVATLHDATHLALKEDQTPVQAAYYRVVVGPRAKRAAALLTVSEFSRRELARHLGVSEYRLQVIPNGVDALFRTSSPAELDDFRRRRGLPARYFAAIGNPKPHKNLSLLLPILDALPAPLALLAGRGARRALRMPETVIELSPLSDADLALFYGGAVAVMVPSRYEGFGLPALEALACGAPVIASSAGAHPEVTGSAAVLVPPDDPAPWLEAAQQLFRDAALRARLAEAGKERAARYSWDDCARKTLEVYRRALG
ncbi:MAG: glycosyltransferase family 4 protein [Myxococcaceae bacterium]|nr:glycosyltransferase family 4 protein [Myxococcaceae bacterium]